MSSFQLLDIAEEDALHKTRLLSVEEKPFKRITKRLLTPNNFLTTTLPITPPPDSSSTDAGTPQTEHDQQANLEARRQFHDEILLDFAAFDSSIARIQFLHNSNAAERERYAAEKLRIEKAAQDVRENTLVLRGELEEAKNKMMQRKEFDKLAEKITNSRMLRTREEQAVNLEKLEEECRELEREREQYSEIWAERREQFGRIVEEGVRLRRLIRDEKEEVERREGMADGEDEENAEESRGGQTPKHSSADAGTPRPELLEPSSSEPRVSSRLKPRSSKSSRHSRTGSRAGSTTGSRTGSRAGSRAGSRPPSPSGSERRLGDIQESDAVMTDVQPDTPMGDAGDGQESAEEGEEVEGPEINVRGPSASAAVRPHAGEQDEDKMDTT